jgi:hypothetical protein
VSEDNESIVRPMAVCGPGITENCVEPENISAEEAERMREQIEEFDELKRKSIPDVVTFLSGFTVNRTGFEEAPDYNVTYVFPEQRFGVLRFYHMNQSIREELAAHNVSLYDLAQMGFKAYYASFPASEVGYLKNSSNIRWFGYIPIQGKIRDSFYREITANRNKTFKVVMSVFQGLNQTKMQTALGINASCFPSCYIELSGDQILQSLNYDFVKFVRKYESPVPCPRSSCYCW